jgi:hypothetical protein
MNWKICDANGHEICIGDWVRTLSGELMVLRDWSPPPTREHRGRVVLHDKHGQIHEHEVGTIGARCVRADAAAKFTLMFDTETDAFSGHLREYEIARILRDVATRVVQGERCGVIRDQNGNRVGHFNGVTE